MDDIRKHGKIGLLVAEYVYYGILVGVFLITWATSGHIEEGLKNVVIGFVLMYIAYRSFVWRMNKIVTGVASFELL